MLPCSQRFYHKSRKVIFEYAGAGGGFIDLMGYPYCRGRMFNTLEHDTGQYNNQIPVFWASGACLFIRREKYLSAGGLDSDFFAHMEEIDPMLAVAPNRKSGLVR